MARSQRDDFICKQGVERVILSIFKVDIGVNTYIK